MFLLNAKTHVDILGQEFVGRLVLLQDVCVDAGAGKGAAEEETEETVAGGTIPMLAHCSSSGSHGGDGDD